MQSSLISKIEKARQYAHEPERITIQAIACRVRGDNSSHTVRLDDGAWRCDCDFFATAGTCSHSMALQRILHDMLPVEQRLAFTAVAS